MAQPNPISPDTLWAGGDGKFESAPDTALVQFSISVQQPELKAAYAKAQESAQNIRQTLQDERNQSQGRRNRLLFHDAKI